MMTGSAQLKQHNPSSTAQYWHIANTATTSKEKASLNVFFIFYFCDSKNASEVIPGHDNKGLYLCHDKIHGR